MMVTIRHPSLIRRLISHHLMFGLISIVSLGLGLFGLERYRSLHSDERQLRQWIHDMCALLADDQSSRDGHAAQALVDLLAAEDRVAFVAAVSPEGVVVAHSRPNRVGQQVKLGLLNGSDEVLIERPTSENEPFGAREFQIAIRQGEQDFGILQVGLVGDSESSRMSKIVDWLPFTVVMPVGVLMLGGVFLSSMSRTNAAIEHQLQAISNSEASDDFRINPLLEPDPAAKGWNRLIERLHGQAARPNLESSLMQSLQARKDQRFETILNVLPDGLAVTDKEGRLSYANRTFQLLMQRQLEGGDWKGQSIQACFPAGADLRLGAAEEGRPVAFDVTLGGVMSEGVLRVGRLPILNEGATQHLWTVRDVTQQRLAEETRNEFISTATHELRTPLANIKAYAETMSDNNFADIEMQKRFLNVINAEATRLSRFVEELLSINQMQAGSLALAQQNIDLDRLLADVIEKVTPQMQHKGITFESTLPQKFPRLNGDKDKLAAALVNLLGNAAKYTPDNGRVSLKVAVGPKELQLSVEDTGIGISAEELPKLFTKFFRSADDRVRDLPGSGLGLAFTQEVVRLHGGKLAVHSELNKGSQFIITFPL